MLDAEELVVKGPSTGQGGIRQGNNTDRVQPRRCGGVRFLGIVDRRGDGHSADLDRTVRGAKHPMGSQAQMVQAALARGLEAARHLADDAAGLFGR